MAGRSLKTESTLATNDFVNMPCKNILDYILSQAGDNECPYVEISILGRKILALLDSGATSIFANAKGYQIINSLGFELMKGDITYCKVANGVEVPCLGKVSVPITLKNKTYIFDVLVIPELRHTFVLGTEFWVKMGIIPNLRKGEWYFYKESECNELCTSSFSLKTAKDLNNSQLAQLNNVVEEYFNSIENIPLGCTEVIEHKIEIQEGIAPIKQRYYRVSHFMQSKINDEIDNMLSLDVIEPSTSEWSSPILMVPKGDGSWRFVVDFRKVNAVSKRPAYPLPFIHEILDQLGNTKYLSSLDIRSAYWQVKLEQNSKQYTAFTVPGKGHYQFKRLAFGLHGAPGTFQSLIDKLFSDLKPQVFGYLDDLILASSDFDSHLKLLQVVFERLKRAGLTLKKEKCNFCREELEYLGYRINREGLGVNPNKVKAIVDMPTPKSARDIKRIIGMLSWYRRFIANFSTIVAPLTKLTHKNIPFKWTSECDEAFREIKSILVSSPILSCPNWNYPFILQTDASTVGLGAVLTQSYDNQEHVICYISRALTKAEMKYGATQLETLSVIWAIERLRCYLEGTKFTLITDCYSLKWLNNLKDPQGRLGRWCLKLQGYDFDIVHRKGREHVVPDCLSRAIPECNSLLNEVSDLNSSGDKWYDRMVQNVLANPLKYQNWQVIMGKLYKHVQTGFKDLLDESDSWKEVIPKVNRVNILSHYHDNLLTGAHLGVYKTYNRILHKYFWPGMKRDVYDYIRKCKVCCSQKPIQKVPAGLMGRRPDISHPWQMISSDLVGPLPRSSAGHEYILVVTDYFSKFVVVIPLRTISAKNVIKAIEEQIFLMFGVPEFIIVDNGTQFGRSNDFKKFLDKYGVRPLLNANYHPQNNPTERVNRVLKTVLSSYIDANHRNWSDNLAHVSCALRTAKSESTRFSPYFVNFGREMIVNGEEFRNQREKQQLVDKSESATLDWKCEGLAKLYQKVRLNLRNAHEKSKQRYDLRRRPVSYQVGDFVWKKDFPLSDASKHFSAKLAPKYRGPYRITRKNGLNVYELCDDTGKSLGFWHVKDLKPNFGDIT